MDDMNDNFVPGLPINLSDLAYAAPFLGAALIGCCTLSLCCYLWRRVIAPRRYSTSFESSSGSFRNQHRASQTQRLRSQNQMANARQNYPRIGHQFVSWAREQMRNPVQSNQTPASNSLLSPVATQNSRATQGRAGNGLNTSRTTAGASNALSDSEGFSQATAPPPSYSSAVGYRNAPTWNLPGYGYQSMDQRTGVDGGGIVQDGLNVLPPHYDTVVGDGQNMKRT